MAKKKKNRKPDQAGLANSNREVRSVSRTGPEYSDWLQSILMLLAIMLVVAAPLIPEGAPEDLLNWPLHFLGMLAAASVFGLRIFTENRRWSFSLVDLCVYGVCTWMVISGLVSLTFQTGHARPTINATWQWFHYAAIYFVLRDLSTQSGFRKLVIRAGWCVALGCASAGIYQRFVILPSLQAAYENKSEEEKQKDLKKGGINQVAPGSRERIMWENRLFSTEPTSTFVLANSLAAYLTAWLLISLGILISRGSGPNWRWQWVLYGGGTLIIAACLLLTKSRTSYLACFLGAILLVMTAVWSQSRGSQKAAIPWRWISGLVVLLGGSLTLTFAFGLLDLEVVSEAFKSMRYRLEYWQASLSLIRDHLWFGCGPGNFQHAYATYQLVQSSETVADPHNFLMEVWALGGTPAALILLMGLIIWTRDQLMHLVRRSGNQPKADQLEDNEPDRSSTSPDPVKNESGNEFDSGVLSPVTILLTGLTSGIFLALFVSFISGLDSTLTIVSGVVSLAAVVVACRFPAEIHENLLAVGLIAFVVGLSASGGISFPSVATTGILLVAISATRLKTISVPINRPILISCVVALVLAIFLFRATVTDPIQKAKSFATAAERQLINSNLEQAVQNLEKATQADPHDGNYQFFLTEGRLQVFRRDPTLANLDQLIAAAEKSVKCRPNNSKVALETGKIFLSIANTSSESSQNKTTPGVSVVRKSQISAIRFLTIAAERRPNDAEHLAYLAYAYSVSGNGEAAYEWAGRALELDELNPHPDRDLDNGPFRYRDGVSALTIEQELRQIRKN